MQFKNIKNKLKEIIKIDGMYIFTCFILLTISLLIITTTFINGDYSLQLPTKNVFGTVSWIITIFLGITGIFILKNIDKKQIDLSKLFILLSIPLGILYCIVNPLGRVPDEEFHARKAMAISQGNFFSHTNENGEASEFMNAKLNELVTRSSENYEEALARLSSPETTDKVELIYTTMALYAPICHLPQAFGMFVTRIFGGTIPIQCYSARIANFAVSIFLIYKAIQLIPFKKHIVLFLALLPVTLEEISSMASDALTISMSLFYISYILYLKYDTNKNKVNKKDIINLATSSIIIALCKIVYLPLCLLLFIVPTEKYTNNKLKNIVSISIFLTSVFINLIWLIYCSKFLVEFNPGVNSSEQIKYVLTHPISYLLILFRTMNVYNQIFIVSLCGEGLGLYNAQASVLFIFPCILLFAMLFFVNNKETIDVNWKTKAFLLFIFISIVLLIYTSLYVQWTTLMRPLVQGVQARYFLPILLLTAIICNNNKIIFNEKLSNRYILMFMLFFNLNAISSIYFTYLNGIIDYYIK